MKKIIFFIIFLIIFVSVGSYLFFLFDSGNKNTIFLETLNQIDDTLLIGDYGKTRVLLNHALTLASSKKQVIQIIKRIYFLAEKKVHPRIIRELLEPLIVKQPRDKDIAFLLAHALLKTGDTEKVHEFLAKYPHTRKLDSLKVQALFMDGKGSETEKYYSPSPPFTYLNLLSARDPSLFEDTGNRLEDSRLMLDAALLYAHKGNIGKAYEIARVFGGSDNPDYYLPLILLAYDTGDYRGADEYIRKDGSLLMKHPEIIPLQGDILLYFKKYDRALESYETALIYNPKISVSSYANCAYISLIRGDNEKGLEWLKKGFVQFPQHKTIVFEAAKFFYALGKDDTAYEILISYAEKHPGDPLLQLMQYALHREGYNPLQYRAGLWDLYNMYPDNELICRFLVVYLSGIEDFQGVASALTLFRKARGIRDPEDEYLPWVFHYKGISEFLSGSREKGILSLTRSLELSRNPIVFYHRGLMNGALHRYSMAIMDFLEVPESNPGILSRGTIFLSMAATALGKMYMATREYEKAWEQCDLALRYNPDNFEVHVLREELEVIQQ